VVSSVVVFMVTSLVGATEDHLDHQPGIRQPTQSEENFMRQRNPLREGFDMRQYADLYLHDLRHLAGTLAARTGAGTRELMHRLGHASHQAALHYQYATQKRDWAIAEALDGLIDPRMI
jgi:integrase